MTQVSAMLTNKVLPIDLARISTVPLKGIPITDPFFDSLREDYLEFNDWYSRVSAEGREAWVVDSPSVRLAALCIFKIEMEGEWITDSGKTLDNRFLKLCTLKVADKGIKYGERLLFAGFNYAVENRLSAIYVQVREGFHEDLVDLLKKHGFHPEGSYKRDISYVKRMQPQKVDSRGWDPLRRLQYDIDFYPYHMDGESVRKFLITMAQGVHDRLFPDARIQTLAFPLLDRPVIGEAHAICKALLQGEWMMSMRPADLLFFYVKGRECHMDCMGIVEDYYLCPKGSQCSDELAEILPYSKDTINAMIQRRDLMVIKFRIFQYFKPITRRKLSEFGFDTNHRSIRRIPEDVYVRVIKPRLREFGCSFDSQGGGESCQP